MGINFLRLQLGLGIMAGILASTASSSWAQESRPTGTALTPPTNQPISLDQLPRPATSVQDWLTQVDAATVKITGVKLERTPTGLDISLETAAGQRLTIDATKFRAEGNNLIADIPNAALTLPSGQGFVAENPTTDITAVQVSQAAPGTVRITVVGKEALPKTEVTLKAGGLAYALNPTKQDENEEVVVTGQGQGRYRVPNTSVGTKTDTPLRDIPQAIQIVPRQVLEDRRVRSVTEALETVSGVLDTGNFNGAPINGRVVRGFNSGFLDGNSFTLRNGLRDSDVRGLIPIGTIEQVETLKGPASVLFGALEPGGAINVVTRQPLSSPYYSLNMEVGNYGYVQPSVDFSGPLNSDRTVLYRFIAGYQGSRTEQPFVNQRLVTVAPSLTLNFSQKTKLNLYYEYANFFSDPLQTDSIRLSDGRLAPRDFYLGYPDFNSYDFTNQRLGYSFTHQFNQNWQLRNSLAIVLGTYLDDRNYPVGLVNDRLVDFESFSYDYSKRNIFGQIDISGKFNTGIATHKILLGFDVNQFNQTTTIFQNIGLPPLDLRNPNYRVTPQDRISDSRANISNFSSGIYFQDQISIGRQFKILVGGRYDWVAVENEFDNFGLFGDTIDSPVQRNSAFSPRLGFVYQPTSFVSLYGSYSRSFIQTAGSNRAGRDFLPTRGTQYEVGIKTDLLNQRLSATLAAYQITRTNVTTPDPVNPLFSIQTGEQRSRGLELDISGEILPGWQIIASYALTNAVVTADNTFPVGNRINDVPTHQASLWTTYTLPKGRLRGLGFGLGLFYVGERPADLDNSFELDGYLRVDAALYYKRDRLKAALNIRNLFDNDYTLSSFGLSSQRGAPFRIVGSLSWEF
jgi:iron complex outermembrane recepter protein